MRDLALPRLVAVEEVVEQAGAARVGEELAAEADEAARRDAELEADAAGAVVRHVRHAALAQRERLRDDADVVLGAVDDELLHRLVALAVDLARDDLGLADRELEALAAHRLDEDRHLQLAAAGHLEGVGGVAGLDVEGDVREDLALEAVLEVARRDVLPVLARRTARC